MRKLIFYYIIIAISFSSLACNKNKNESNPLPNDTSSVFKPKEYNNLDTAIFQSSFSKEILYLIVSESPYQTFATEIESGISTYRIIYSTKLNGQSISASGLLHLPESIHPYTPILCFQHGTTFKKSDAPSLKTTGAGLFAGMGFITLEADYIGYGSSSQVLHPYYDLNSSADAIIDIIYATFQFLSEEDLNFERPVILCGYSEGGYVTLATQYKIEGNQEFDDIPLAGVAAGAGGYDLVDIMSGIVNDSIYPYPAYLAFLITGYNETYGWNTPYNDIFNSPYGDKFPALVNGINSGSEINAELTNNTHQLLNQNFTSGLKEGNSQFYDALVINSPVDWAPETELRLYHGTDDEIVPFGNSEMAYENFMQNGSTSVTFFELAGKDHGSGGEAMIQDIIPWLKSFK